MISSPSRYLVRTSSSASAAASSSWSRRRATSSAMSAGIVRPRALAALPDVRLAMDEVDVAPELSAWPMASWSGAILLPNAARRASSAAMGSAFSRSQRVMTKSAAVPCARASATARSVPASTPPEASMVMSAASAAAKPSTTSPTKSA